MILVARMCPSRRSVPEIKAPPSLVDNSHNERMGLSVLSIHAESVVGTLGVLGLIVMFSILLMCIYKYVKGREQVLTTTASPATLSSMSYTAMQRSAPAMMEALERGHGGAGQRMIQNFSQDDLDEILRVVCSAGR